MPLQPDVLNALKPYCVETNLVWHRRWTPEWTFNDFAEALSEYILTKKTALSDQQLQGLVLGLIDQFVPYPECSDFIKKLKPFVSSDTTANTATLLHITRQYREKFIFIPPIDSASAVVMSYGDEQELYMSLMIDALDTCADRLKKLNPEILTFEIFLDELNELALQRQNIAHKCHHNSAVEFGTPRWKQTDQFESVNTRLSSSNYTGLNAKCAAKRNPNQDFSIDKISQENLSSAEKITLAQAKNLSCTHYENYFLEINNEKIPTTHLAWNDKGTVFFLHTLPLYVLPILKSVFPLWQKAMQPQVSPRDLLEAIARIEYRLQHAMPWRRGSAAITSVFNYALLKKQGYEMVPTQPNRAIYWEALATRTEDEFVNLYTSIFAVHPTALVSQKQALAHAKLSELRQILSDVRLPEASDQATPAYQSKIQPDIFKLKQKLDDPNAPFDSTLETEIQDYCKQHETSPYAQQLRATLHPFFDRQKAPHQVVLWGSSAPKPALTSF